MTYNRPWKSFKEQLELLKARGITVADESAALAWLQRVGYYRLSAYSYPFRQTHLKQDPQTGRLTLTRLDQFETDTSFDDIVALYLFDKELRLLIMEALENIEVALRVDIAYLLGQHNTFAHHDASQFNSNFASKITRTGNSAYVDWQNKYKGLIDRSREDFVTHYRQRHGPDLPIWVACEVWDFGAMYQLFAMMKVEEQERIADKYGIAQWQVFVSWLRSLNYLRNLAAHHSRLWNRNVVDQPKLPKQQIPAWCNSFSGATDLISRPFLLVAIVRHMQTALLPDSSWKAKVESHLLGFPAQHSKRKLSLLEMGAPGDWRSWW